MRRLLLPVLLLLACSPSKTNSDKESEKTVTTTLKANPVAAPENKSPEPSADGQSFKVGMQRICESINKVDSDLDPSERQRAVAAWIDENVTNPEVRELFSIMGNVPPSKRAGMMRAAAAKAGVESCAIAEQ